MSAVQAEQTAGAVATLQRAFATITAAGREPDFWEAAFLTRAMDAFRDGDLQRVDELAAKALDKSTRADPWPRQRDTPTLAMLGERFEALAGCRR